MRVMKWWMICGYGLLLCIGLFAAVQAILPDEALAQGTMPEPRNYYARGGVCVLGFVVLWFVCYYLLYPFLLQYYTPEASEDRFWSIIGLYGMTWACISIYVILELGIYHYYARWVFAFIGVIWIIWLIVILFKKD